MKRSYTTKKSIDPSKLLSVYSHDRKTYLCYDSGEEASTCMAFYEVAKLLPEDEFIFIKKGIALRLSAILSISDDGIYTTRDGRTFQGSKRYLADHKRLRNKLCLSDLIHKNEDEKNLTLPLTLLEKCSLVEDMPVGFCIIELVFDEHGHGLDFIFRYCNKYMEVIEGKAVEDMVNHSFYEVFENGDRKWLVAYADVALNGVTRILKDYSPEVDKTLTIHCYQPEEGYCACLLQVE